jgi:hypothetical protein
MKTLLFTLILSVLLTGTGQADEPVVINELMASNNSIIQDPQGQYDDWIEIYNFGSASINIGGMYLTDELSIPTKWQIPFGTIIAGRNYLLIWADDDTSDIGLHTNFKLSADGEQIALFDGDGTTLIDSIVFPGQTTDTSFGRYPDAAETWRFFDNPTPAAQNQGGYVGTVADTKFSHNRGFYDSPFDLTIATETEGAVIRYTTDGSAPTETSGRIYTGPVRISTTTCVRTIAYKTGWRLTNVDTQTYIFIDDVITQSQQHALSAGYPNSWSGYPADYEMDPEVTNDPEYSGQMADALLSIPTLSIVTDKEYLFDPTIGIYMNPEKEGNNLEWERPTSAELFCPDGSMEFQINCGLRLQGGHSRKPEKSPKHSFSLRFRDIYGPTSLDYPLFGEDWPVKSFDSLQLRGFFNNAWTHWGPDQRERAQYIHDQWARDAMTEMGNPDALQGFIVHLYLNGMYWGIYNLHERPDADHYAAYNGNNGEQIDAVNGDPDYVISDPLNTGSVSDGTIDAWHDLKNVVAGRNWDAICKVLDVNNFIDWTILNYFEGNTDLKRGTNWRAAGGGPQHRLWRFYSWDAEHIFENLNQTNTGEADPSTLYNNLDDIEEFRIRLADRINKHLSNNGALTKERNLARWRALSDEVQLAVIAESARWGDYRRDMHPWSSGPYYLYTKNEFWIPENNYVSNNYLPYRTAYALINVFRNRGMYPSVNAPDFYINGSEQNGGLVRANSIFSMTGDSGSLYYTLDGSDPHSTGQTNHSSSEVTLVAENAGKRVLVPTGSINNNWKGGSYFNDAGWISGTGGVGYEQGSGYEQLISLDLLNRMYDGNTTCYIRIPFALDAPSEDLVSLQLKIRYDDGFIAYLNGTEVARRNFSGTPSWNSSADTTHSDSEAVNFEEIDISPYLIALHSGNNILAIQGLNASPTSSDFLISTELTATQDISSSQVDSPPGVLQYTSPVTLTRSTLVKSRVLSGNTWSALNEGVFAVGPVAENLRITEIMYHPDNDPNDEFIELTNIGSETINLNLVKFTNGIDFTFPSIDLAPGEFTVIVQDQSAFTARYGTGINIAGQYTGRLNNAGEKIRLEDALGQMILEFSYKDGWRSITDGEDFSLTIINPANPDPESWDEKDSWRASAYPGGSPGRDDTGEVPDPGSVVINEILAHSHENAPDWIELYNTTAVPIDIGGWFISDSNTDLTKYKIAEGTTLAPYGYRVYYEDQNFNNPSDPGSLTGFALSENGESLYLNSAQNGLLTGYREVEDFGASQTGISFGRYFKSSTGNYNFVAMSQTTPGSANAYPKVGPVVISEIMYNPDWPVGGSYTNDQYEYIELRNISSGPVMLYDDVTGLAWKFTDGIDFTFPEDAPVTIPAGGFLLVVKNPEAFSWRYLEYLNIPSDKIFGPYEGSLDNAGETVELSMPGEVDGMGNAFYIRVDRVSYSDGSHPADNPGGIDLWPSQADGEGYSLTRKVLSDYGNDPANWLAALPTPNR